MICISFGPSLLPLFLKPDHAGGAGVIGFSRQCYPPGRGEGESQNTGKKSNFPGGWAEEAA